MRLFPTLLAAALAAPSAHAAELDALKWKARPLVVLSDGPDDARAARQAATLARAGAGLRERQIAVLRETSPDGSLHKRLGLTGRGFAVVLVGKDGDVKRVWREPVEAARIFELIDGMPMRRDEMGAMR